MLAMRTSGGPCPSLGAEVGSAASLTSEKAAGHTVNDQSEVTCQAVALHIGDVPTPLAASREWVDVAPLGTPDELGEVRCKQLLELLVALGPASGGRALTTAVVPDLPFTDADGNPFSLTSLHGRKVLLVAWASW